MSAAENAPGHMRTYRACIVCRQRKTRCHLDPVTNLPPCSRCVRAGHECVLAPPTALRKNRRADRVKTLQGRGSSQPDPRTSQGVELGHSRASPQPANTGRQSLNSTSDVDRFVSNMPGMTSENQAGHSPMLENTIAGAVLHNTSDAMGILAHVAGSSDGYDSIAAGTVHGAYSRPLDHNAISTNSRGAASNMLTADQFVDYTPFIEGKIDYETIKELVESYERNYHPFFPIVPRSSFQLQNVQQFSKTEPYLFSAILTVAATDPVVFPNTFDVCYDHMQKLVLSLTNGATTGIDGVEALLLLAEWVSHRSPYSTAGDRGAEDKVVWMYVGTAVRLGYFMDLDRASSSQDNDAGDTEFNARKTLDWAACYMCDRNVSVRLGKGFWSRGPGPTNGLKSHNFPPLQPMSPGENDYATIMQANLELTQLFSNAHDILYSRKGRGWRLMIEGDYIKYIDDFRSGISDWHRSWGMLTCNASLKASLLLSYEFLRLYVNAFAYQATISRSIIAETGRSRGPYCQLPVISAATPDARFIYESVEAAKSLLTTLNNFVDPEHCLRYMPSRFYLFVVYSAVFLYKALSTGTMSAQEVAGVRRMVQDTISRLQKAGVNQDHMGTRYAQLLLMLWRATPSKDDDRTSMASPEVQPGAFSWLDLEAVGNFATYNYNNRVDLTSDFGDILGDPIHGTMTPLFTDYRWLSDDNLNMIF